MRHQPPLPQDLLNEARLSALALNIYFAGRLTCMPAVASDAFKLLVLDDVLIGLDQANRLRMLRNVVLNPYSHPLAPNIPTAEVHNAIAEVERLIAAFDGKP